MSLDEIRRKVGDVRNPVIIRTSDGREFPIRHKEFVFLTRRFVVVADQEGFTDTLDPLHIVSIRETGALPVS